MVAEEIVVVLKVGENPAEYRDILPGEVNVLVDAMQSKAPLVGIMTGTRAATSEYSAVLSCDLALLNPQVLDYLFDQVQGLDAIVPHWPDGRFEPLHSVYETRAAVKAAENALREGDYRNISVARRIQRVRYIPVDELRRFDPELLTFFNVNSAEDLETAERLLAER